MSVVTIVRDLKFRTIIGMLDFERTKEQEVIVNAEFTSDEFIDYAVVAWMIPEFYNEHKFQSVEESVVKFSEFFKLKFPQATWIKFEILKTQILENASVGARIEKKF